MSVDRSFLLVANRADPSGTVPLDDLPGAGGRFDLVARFITASLLTSHGIREDTEAIVLFTRADPDPVALRVKGSDVIGLRPDERSTAARLNKILSSTAMPVWQEISDGFALNAVDLETLLEEALHPIVELHEAGDALGSGELSGGTFVLGDQDGLTDQQRGTVQAHADATRSIGPVPLQADQVVTVVHNALDRWGGGSSPEPPSG